jgi:hypothetical protein
MKSTDSSLQQDNMFLHITIFRVIFDTLYFKESTIPLSERTLKDNRSQLWYGNQRNALGQGDKHAIAKLKNVIEELITNDDIKSRVEEYRRLRKQLSNHEKIDALMEMIEKLYTYVHGGRDLGGFGVCELCDPNVSASDL